MKIGGVREALTTKKARMAGLDEEPLQGVDWLAAMLNVEPSWVYRAAEAGHVPHLKIGKYLRFRPTEIRAWLASQRAAAR